MKIAQFLLKKWQEIEVQEKIGWVNPPLEYWLRWQYDNCYVPYQKLFNLEPLTYGKWLSQPIPRNEFNPLNMNETLLKLTRDFIKDFQDAYREEDKTATDSYITNMVLPDYISAAIPVDMERVFYAPLMGQGIVSEFIKAEYKKNIRDLAPVLENVFANHKIWTDSDEDSYRIALVEALVHEYETFKYSSDTKLIRSKNKGVKYIFDLSNTRNNFKVQIEVYRDKDQKFYEVIVIFGRHDRYVIKFRKDIDLSTGTLTTWLDADLPFGMSENIRNTNSFWLAMQVIDQFITEKNGHI